MALIALSAARIWAMSASAAQRQFRSGRRACQGLGSNFPGAFYLEVQRGQPQRSGVQQTADPGGEAGLAAGRHASHAVHEADDFRAHEAQSASPKATCWATPAGQNLHRNSISKTQDEMVELFADLPGAGKHAGNRPSLQHRNDLGKNFLPDFPTPEGMTSTISWFGKPSRPGGPVWPSSTRSGSARPAPAGVRRASRFRCKTILQMGFPGYFLIVADFINWGKQNGVPVGPGRGSSAGSLVAYSPALPTSTRSPALLFERY